MGRRTWEYSMSVSKDTLSTLLYCPTNIDATHVGCDYPSLMLFTQGYFNYDIKVH